MALCLFAVQVGGGDAAPGAGVPVHRQARRGVPRQLDARRQDHQARHQGGAGVLRRRQLGPTRQPTGRWERESFNALVLLTWNPFQLAYLKRDTNLKWEVKMVFVKNKEIDNNFCSLITIRIRS